MTGWRSVQCLALLLLSAVLLQTIAIAVTFIYFNSVLITMKETFSRSSIACLTRSNLRTVKGLDLSVKEGKDDPCWQVTQQFHFLVEKAMSNRYKKQISSKVKDEVSRILPSVMIDDHDFTSRPEIAAHVTGTSMTEMDDTEESPSARSVPGHKIRSWNSERGLAFLRNVQLSNGELEVPRAGLYYIYSQTYFRVSRPLEDGDKDGIEEGPENLDRGKQMLQYIYKKVTSYPVPILLMKNARTTCWAHNVEYSLYSIYQAGVFQLGAGDRIFVSVSDVTAVGMDENSSFFGAFMLT